MSKQVSLAATQHANISLAQSGATARSLQRLHKQAHKTNVRVPSLVATRKGTRTHYCLTKVLEAYTNTLEQPVTVQLKTLWM